MPGLDQPLTPFAVPTFGAALEDLTVRLRATRWPDAPEGSGWSLGVDVAYLRDLVSTWVAGFDYSAHQNALHPYPRYRAELQDPTGRGALGIHLVHARASAPTSSGGGLPLLLCHGWPDSTWRYSKVLPLLVDPQAHDGSVEDAFDVVVPDMPGFGWSDTPARVIDSVAVAHLWAQLMTDLGYERFAVAGGDIGSGVARWLALEHPNRVVAVHRMDAGIPVVTVDPAELSDPELDFVDQAGAWGAAEGAYAAMHRTKAQTAAVGLTDSPAGLAAWVVEKLRSWSDCGGDLESVYEREDVLGLLTEYWLTGTIGSSMRMYAANAAIPASQHARKVEVPSGFSLFPGDLLQPPIEWLVRTANTVRVTHPERGGHFAPFEQPQLYATEVRDFFRPYR